MGSRGDEAIRSDPSHSPLGTAPLAGDKSANATSGPTAPTGQLRSCGGQVERVVDDVCLRNSPACAGRTRRC
jgi:hypothetical protein